MVTYYWASFKNNTDFNNLLIKSVVANYVLTAIFDGIVSMLPSALNNYLHNGVAYCFFSITLGFAVGTITSHRIFNLLLYKLHIGRTTNGNIWDDVIKPYTWLCVHMKDGSSYLGQYRYGEQFKSEPIIALATYQKLNKDNDVVIDNSQDLNRLIMLNTKDFEKIEVVYQPPENKIKKAK